MIGWIMILFTLAIAYYTLTYAKIVWVKEKNKIAVLVITLIGVVIAVLPLWMKLSHQLL